MNPAIRGGVILLICLLAIFPCGAALTVIGTMLSDAVRASLGGEDLAERLMALWMPLLWASSGVVGFLFLVGGVDKLIATQRRLPWYGLLAICLEIVAAGLFSSTYPLRGPSAIVFRLISIAPVVIALGLLVYHLCRYIFFVSRLNPATKTAPDLPLPSGGREPPQP